MGSMLSIVAYSFSRLTLHYLKHAKNQKQRQATSVSDESLQASRQTSATDNKIASFLNANSADSENSYKRSSGEGISPINKLLPPAQFLGWRSAGTQIWARLKMAGLDVKVAFSWDLRQVLLKVSIQLIVAYTLKCNDQFMHFGL